MPAYAPFTARTRARAPWRQITQLSINAGAAPLTFPGHSQFKASDYDSPEDKEYRSRLNEVQYVALLKSQSDADRGKSNFHGVSRRNNGKWQSRITGIAVRCCCALSWACVTGCVVHALRRGVRARAVLWYV